jgi:hypothetical protein
MGGSYPQRVVSHLPNIATLHRGMHFSTCTDVVWSWRLRLPALNGVARLVHFQGRGGCEKEYSLYVCDNDEKDGHKQTSLI